MSKKESSESQAAPSTGSPVSTASQPRRYFVAKGREMTSRRGLLPGGAEIFPRDFAGGQAVIDYFVKKGCAVEK